MSRQVGIAIAAAVVIAIAVVGVFVIQGGNQGPGPSATIEAEQSSPVINTGNGPTERSRVRDFTAAGPVYVNANRVTLTHTGGEEVNQRDVKVRVQVVNGSESVTAWAVQANNSTDTPANDLDGDGGNVDDLGMVTGTGPTWNSQENATISSSDSVSYFLYLPTAANNDNFTAANGKEGAIKQIVTNDVPCDIRPQGTNKMDSENTGYANPVSASNEAMHTNYYRDNAFGVSCVAEGLNFGQYGWDYSGGFIKSGDTVQAVWSPPDANESAPLVTYEVE